MRDKRALGQELKLRLRARGLDQNTLADSVGVSRGYLNRVLNGSVHQVSSTVMRRICDELSVPSRLYRDLLRTYTDEPFTPITQELQRQQDRHDKLIWLFSGRLLVAQDDSAAKQLTSNLNHGINYVVWSDDENELLSMIDNLVEQGATHDTLQKHLTCIAGPPWIRFMLWRVTNPEGDEPVVHRIETRGLVPDCGAPAEDYLAFYIRDFFAPILRRVRDSRSGEFKEYKLVYPTAPE